MFSDRLVRLALFLLICIPSIQPAQADTIPATPNTVLKYRPSVTGATHHDTLTSACSYAPRWALAGYTFQSYISSSGGLTHNSTFSCTATVAVYGAKTIASFGVAENVTVYTCPNGYTLDAGGTTCTSTVTCPAADTLQSKGFYNVGTSPSGQLLKSACVGSCGVYIRNGYTPAGRTLINGVYYYFGQAEYFHTGQSCSPDTPNFLSDFVGQIPNGTCAPGQSFITMNGVTKCIDSGTGEDVNAASAAAAAQTLLDQRAQAAASAAMAAATMAGADASAVQAAGVQAAAEEAAKSATILNAQDPQQAAYCLDNPEAPICAGQDFGTVEDATLEEKTINVAITPVSIGGAGSCPAPTPYQLHGKTVYFEWGTYCEYASGIRPILLAFAWLTAAGILVGGFRSA